MKYYGIEIKRFCGVDVSTDSPIPVIIPEFLVNIPQRRNNFIVELNAVDKENFVCLFNIPSRQVFKAVYEVKDKENFAVMIDKKPRNSFNVIMAEYEVN